jgi:hypothetical protein
VIYFKALKAGRKAPHNGYQWPKPGVWTKEEIPQLCSSGWHVSSFAGLHRFIAYCDAKELWLCEVRGQKTRWDDGKMAVSQARLVRKLPMPAARLYSLMRRIRTLVIELSSKDIAIEMPFFSPSFSKRELGKHIAFFHALYTGKKLYRHVNVFSGAKVDTKSRKLLKAIALEFFRELEVIWSIDLGLPNIREKIKL